MKIVVYAIAKNETKFAARFMASAAEADQVVVLDTGSTDSTVRKLRKLGARVFESKLKEFRFDHARTEALSHVPEDTDVFVVMDLDEVINKGWRKKLEEQWEPGTVRGQVVFNWSFNHDGSPAVQFMQDRVHGRGFKWKYAAHEVLTGPEGKSVMLDGVVFNHHPDPNKSRGQYLSLLEIDVQENPRDRRCLHYLGREYMYAGRHQDSIKMLERYLACKDAAWDQERCASRRFIARGYAGLGNFPEALRQCWAAIVEAPHMREPYMDMADIAYRMKDWETVRYMCMRALAIDTKVVGYPSEAVAWNERPFDLLAVACGQLGRLREGYPFAKAAAEFNPGDPRLALNVDWFEKALQKAGVGNGEKQQGTGEGNH